MGLIEQYKKKQVEKNDEIIKEVIDTCIDEGFIVFCGDSEAYKRIMSNSDNLLGRLKLEEDLVIEKWDSKWLYQVSGQYDYLNHRIVIRLKTMGFHKDFCKKSKIKVL